MLQKKQQSSNSITGALRGVTMRQSTGRYHLRKCKFKSSESNLKSNTQEQNFSFLPQMTHKIATWMRFSSAERERISMGSNLKMISPTPAMV